MTFCTFATEVHQGMLLFYLCILCLFQTVPGNNKKVLDLLSISSQQKVTTQYVEKKEKKVEVK